MLHRRLLAAVLVLLIVPPSLHAQAFVLGVAAEGGYAFQHTSAFGSFADDYNDVFAADLERPFDGLSRLRGFEGGLRVFAGGTSLTSTVGLGIARLRTDDETRTRDTGGRHLSLHADDFWADLEFGQVSGLRGGLGLTLRETTLRSERRFSTGATDDADGPGLSGVYHGYATNVTAGVSYNLLFVSPGGTFTGLRLAATYPVFQSGFSGSRELTFFDGSTDRTFPDAYGAQGAPADAAPVRANMGGVVLSLRLTLGLAAAFR